MRGLAITRGPARRTISGKLDRLVLLAVGSAMFFVAAFGCWQEANRFVDGKRDLLLGTANALAAASVETLASQDVHRADAVVRSIGALADIKFAKLTDQNGKTLADIGVAVGPAESLDLTDRDARPSPVSLVGIPTVSVTVPVNKSGAVIGHLELVGGVSDLWTRLRGVLWSTLLSAFAALAIGLGVSRRVQQSITQPLIALTGAMKAIETDHRYDTYVRVHSNDEIGTLATSFNRMLREIQQRDHQLVAHRDQLEHDIAERTHDLRIAKEEAENANRAKSTFLAVMSHEIRTPMTGLLVMAELLVSSDIPARARRQAEVISKSGSALLAIINDILDFSKIEAGKLEIEHIEINIREIVNTVVALFYSRASDKNLDLAARFSKTVPTTVMGDPVRLQQVISNLVNNALKFTKAGHVLVNVDYEWGQLVFSVADTGVGITSDKIEGIFRAFSQADGSTTREYGGTGLGLAISRRLAEAMGGAITVASTPASGSTFTCAVPAPIIENAPAPAAAGSRGRAVLMLERSATAAAVNDALERAGYDVCTNRRPSADDAPSIVIIDRPGVRDTVDLAAGTPIVELCEPGSAEPVEAAESGVLALRLPFVEDDLLDLLGNLAGKAQTTAKASPTASPAAQDFGHARVLVADDTAVSREVMIEALGRFGIVPDLVVNGREALEASSTTPYDLVFMDGSMPELDGFEACRQLRTRETARDVTRSTPVLALTAHVVGAAADAWREAGMDGVLHKPFTMAELQRALAKHLLRGCIDAEPSEASVDLPVAKETPSRPLQNLGKLPLLDESVLAEIATVSRNAEHGFSQRVFGLYAYHAPRHLEAIVKAQANQDCAGLAAAAHAIKSMSLNIGARQAAAAAAHLEQSARAGVQTQEEIDELTMAVARTCDALIGRFAGPAPEDRARRASTLV